MSDAHIHSHAIMSMFDFLLFKCVKCHSYHLCNIWAKVTINVVSGLLSYFISVSICHE